MVADDKEMRKAGRKGWMMRAWESAEGRMEDDRIGGMGKWPGKPGSARQRVEAVGGLLIIRRKHTRSY